MSIKYIAKDLFAEVDELTQPLLIAHIVNNLGVWGAGFVVPLGKKFPAAKSSYLSDWANFSLGDVQFVNPENNLWVANVFGQEGVGISCGGRVPIRYWAVEKAFERIAAWQRHFPQGTVVAPRLGCSLAGGEFNRIARSIHNTFDLEDNDLYIYTLPSEVHLYDNPTIEELL